MIAPNDARVYGYARRSSDGQILSLQAQKDRIHERADSLGMTVDHVFEETESAKEVAWNKRPVCIDLRNALRKGDTLIVWQIKRLDRNFWRNFWRQLDCARFFGEHGIRLIILDFNGVEFDLNTAMGRCIFTIMCSFADMEQESRIDAVKRGVSLLQQGELWFRTGKNKPRFGRRWEWVEVGEDFRTRRAGSTRRQREAWDEHECNLIREVWVRYHHLHQSRREIGRIFLKQGMPTSTAGGTAERRVGLLGGRLRPLPRLQPHHGSGRVAGRADCQRRGAPCPEDHPGDDPSTQPILTASFAFPRLPVLARTCVNCRCSLFDSVFPSSFLGIISSPISSS
ncbi:MAG: recombinase family protein [Planctomycetota bacterium]|jgi:DNA invertase Pin-like site-specific DNA recombinase